MSEPVADAPLEKHADSQRTRQSFSQSAAFGLFGAVLFLVAMQLNGWVVTTANGSTSSFAIGNQCINAKCTSLVYDADVNLGQCTVSGSTLRNRHNAVRWHLYVAIAMSLVATPSYAMVTFGRMSFCNVGLVTQLLSTICSVVSAAVFAATYEQWYYCGTSFCNYFHNQGGFTAAPCYRVYGAGLVMVGCGACFEFLGLVIAVAALFVQRKRAHKIAKLVAIRSTQPAPTGFAAPAGFYFDAPSGLFYSDEAQLYLDPQSCHYYDPASGMWFDPDRDVWYELSERDADGSAPQ